MNAVIASYTRGPFRSVNGREIAIEELPTPDLDQIKQEEQERGTGVGGFRPRGDALADTTTPQGCQSSLRAHGSALRAARGKASRSNLGPLSTR